MKRTITYINTPASFGAEIAETEDGRTSTMQLANPRDTMTLLFAMKPEGKSWTPPVPVTKPERFMTTPPATQRDWERVIEAWIAYSDDTAEEVRR